MKKLILFGLIFFLALAVRGLAINVIDCGVISTNNTAYNLTANVSATLTVCMDIHASNITFNCLGNRIVRGTGIYGIVSQNNQNVNLMNCNVSGFTNGYYFYNTTNINLSNSIASSNSQGIYLNDLVNNSFFVNNSVSSNTYGIFIQYSSSFNNSFINGSIANNTADYYIATSTANFTNTNFTGSRIMHFPLASAWFNYNNDSKSIWLKSGNIIGATQLTRKLISWSNNTMQWNDTSGAIASLTYNLTGLYTDTTYSLFINSVLNRTIATDVNGALNFTIDTLNSLVPTEIKLIANTTITNCSGGGTPYLNFTAYNEETSASMNFSQDMTIILRDISGMQITNASFQLHNWTNYSICISPANQTFYADATIKYWNDTFGNSRYYYLDNATLSGLQNISLYLSNSASTVTFIIGNEQGLGQSNVIVQVQRWFIGTDAYPLVAEGLTDSDGYAYINLKSNEWYKYILIQNGLVAREFSTQYLNTTSVSLSLSSIEIPSYFSYYDKVAYSCLYNNTANTITCTYSDVSGSSTSMCLRVENYTLQGSSVVCDECSSSASSTLVCDLPAGNHTYKANLYGSFCCSTTSWFNLWQQWIQTAGTVTSRFGLIGVFVAFILIMLMFFIGLWNYGASIVLGMFGLVMSYTFGLLNITETAITTLIGVIVIGAIIIYEMKT